MSRILQLFLTSYARHVTIVLSIISSLILAQVSFIAAAAVFLGSLLLIISILRPEPHVWIVLLLSYYAVIWLWLTFSFPLSSYTAYIIFQAPVAPTHLKAILEQSQFDERQFLVNEQFTLVMTGKEDSISIEEMRIDDGTITSISDETEITTFVPPFTMKHGQTILVDVTKMLTSHAKGFLVNEVIYTPSDVAYSYLDDSGQANSSHIILDPGHGTGPVEVELDEFPKESFWGSNWPGEIQPYGNSVIIRWNLPTIRPGLKFLYIPRPYYSLRWLFSPMLGITASSDALASVAGIAIPFLMGIAITAFINISKEFAAIQTKKLKEWLHRLFHKRIQRRQTLEKILPDGISVDEYLEREKKRHS